MVRPAADGERLLFGKLALDILHSAVRPLGGGVVDINRQPALGVAHEHFFLVLHVDELVFAAVLAYPVARHAYADRVEAYPLQILVVLSRLVNPIQRGRVAVCGDFDFRAHSLVENRALEVSGLAVHEEMPLLGELDFRVLGHQNRGLYRLEFREEIDIGGYGFFVVPVGKKRLGENQRGCGKKQASFHRV